LKYGSFIGTKVEKYMPRAGWISLNDYASKYKISLSTLRRRIRAGELEYEIENGRYWLPNQPTDTYKKTRQQMENSSMKMDGAHFDTGQASDAMAVAQLMLTELKAAYIRSLQEKEEQILELKEEIADLKTLIKILEQNAKKNNPPPDLGSELDSWS
jgi:hypothetical protein